MKFIQTNGITDINELENSNGWYWGIDHTGGDLYEANELFQAKDETCCSRLIFLHFPDGRMAEPIKAKVGQYFGKPIYFHARMYLLTVDFLEEMIFIFQWNPDTNVVKQVTVLPLATAIDCYNLNLYAGKELILLREGGGELFQIIWPEMAQFPIGERETFSFQDEDKLYFSHWEEDTDYREEVIVRKFPTGEILEVIPGTLLRLPMSQYWILR